MQICFGKLSAGADWYLNEVGRYGNNDRDVVGRSSGATSSEVEVFGGRH